MYPRDSEIAHFLQANQYYLWRYLLAQKAVVINFESFYEGIVTYFGLKSTKPYRDDVKLEIEYILVKDLALYGLVEATTVKEGWSERVTSFKLTTLGEHIFRLFCQR